MAALLFSGDERINLASAEVVLADGHAQGLDLLSEMFAGFGVMKPHRCSGAAEIRDIVALREINLFVIDSALADTDGYEFIRWLRRSGVRPNSVAPVLLLTGHTRKSDIFKGRDCGANFVLRKPAAPLVMLQRIMWVSRETRQYVESPGYVGPDRRFRMLGPPPGEKGRRSDDLSAEVGAATEPNLGQDDIDALFAPKRVSL
jgi:DNA-binding response OmpR family regulator